MGKVRTVLGDVAAETIGPAMVHEHVLFDIVPPGVPADRDMLILPHDRWQIDYRSNETQANAHQTDPDIASTELVAFGQDGGSLIVDQSVSGLARDAAGLARASRQSSIHVVAAAGTYTAAFLNSETLAMDEATLTARFTAEINIGIDGTDIRAGLIGEMGCSWPLHPFEHRALIAAARTQVATGAAISVHPGRHVQACSDILDILEANGADLTRVILCHMDRTYPDGDGIQSLLDRGATVEWDFFGIEQSHYWMSDLTELPSDLGRLRLIHQFSDMGYGAQITLSQDICTKTRLRTWGGHGYGHILRNVCHLMNRLAFPPSLVANLLRENPLKLLTLKENAT